MSSIVAAAVALQALFATGFIVFPKRCLSKGLGVTISLAAFSSRQRAASVPRNKSLIAGGRPGAVMSAVEDLAGRFLEPGVAAERGVDHDPAHDEPEAPGPIEGVRLL